jgi:phage major head subunit gpT-like protein
VKIRPTAEQRAEMLRASSQLAQPIEIANVVLRAGDSEIDDESRADLLARCLAGELVSLILEIDAYEQREGEHNRAFIKLAPKALAPAARSAKGRPFLRDHLQADSLARGGKILDAKSVKRGEGDYVIRMTVQLTAPWAVEMALRDLLSFISIGLRATGPVLCSHCGTEVFTECWHYRGEEIVTKVGAPSQRCEWIYTSAEIVEASSVNVPAVVGAHIESIRAALSALEPVSIGEEPKKESLMKNLPMLLAALNLAATAGEEEILSAVAEHNRKLQATEAQLGIVTNDLASAATERDTLRAAQLAAEATSFIEDAIGEGKIAPADKATWSTLYAAAKDKAIVLMSERKPGTATPVGMPRQTPAVAPAEKPTLITGGTPALHIALTAEDFAADERARVIAELMSNPRARHYAAKMWGLRGEGLTVELGATAINNNADLDASRVGFHAAFLTGLEQKADDPVSELYTTVPSTGNLEEWDWLGDIPGFEEWKGERKMSGLEAFKLRVSNKDWSSGLKVKANDFKDDKLGLLPPQIAGMATKARRHRWDMMVKLLANGFAGSLYPEVGNGLGYDGGFFFNTTRGTGSNKLTSALDATSLSAAELLLESMTTYDLKDPMDIHGTHLIVGPKLRAPAEKLLTQERLANGEDNYHRGKYKLIVSQRLRGAADDYWFLVDLSSPIKPLLFQMREEISTSAQIAQDSESVFARNEYRYGAQARYNVAYFEHRLAVGSQVA